MNNPRILIPWDELPADIKARYSDKGYYEKVTEVFTHSLRMPNEWTESEFREWMDFIDKENNISRRAATKALEIATREVKDPREEMDEYWKRAKKYAYDGWSIWQRLKEQEGKS